ncbi:transcriptional regulator family 1 [Mesorhizobium alhagi CCNWXJ12-2]|jgi:DNA-binding SARP family transcriptional activator/TolB-like protein/Tfp pilus assembly protein PilF|uniref:Transcriptional regulator family 1 n=2 Tax=Allomesorhizobium alhagi TaxID=475067 RepID=H0HJG8_9HYPH|nr:transcriptional regulator family 1 [Mesorhizobium alhagi CCNWXJ12-2]
MGMRVESDSAYRASDGPSLQVRLLGTLAISRDGVALQLPGSRKVRALLTYLSLAGRAVTRSQLCELLWDVPNDPRGELRWCLSKVRGIVDNPGRRRVEARDDTIRLNLADCFVDAIEIAGATQEGIETIAPARLRILAGMFAGDFADGLEIDRSPAFNGWLTAQRRRFRGCHAALLERLVGSVPDDEIFGHLDKWLEIAPFDHRVHELLLNALARRGRIKEGEEHLAATCQLFEFEGLESTFIRDAWRAARARSETSPRVEATVPIPATAASSDRSDMVTTASRRASIAVMPFVDRNTRTSVHGGPADGLAHDIITRLAKLRTLFIIAQGTVFALQERGVGPEEAGRMLNVDYVVSGSLRQDGNRLTISVELAETRTARIVWTEVFSQKLDDTFLVLDEIGNKIVASIASEIETIERNRAILMPPNSLDAWEAHHRGLWHMYRLNKSDNERAQHFFETAVRLDPTFARAHAGLSFTHWQNAFQGWAKRGPETDRAFEIAGQSLMADDRDPAAHWAMGRALWLRGHQDQSIVEFEQAVDLSPNFAVAHYNVAFVHATAGDSSAAISSSDHARDLSPFDPMLFGMLGARAMALVRLGRFDEAADWAVKAAARPNAFAHIRAIAAFSLALAGRLDEARVHLASIHKTLPLYRVDDLITAMQFDPHGAALFREGAKRLFPGG